MTGVKIHVDFYHGHALFPDVSLHTLSLHLHPPPHPSCIPCSFHLPRLYISHLFTSPYPHAAVTLTPPLCPTPSTTTLRSYSHLQYHFTPFTLTTHPFIPPLHTYYPPLHTIPSHLLPTLYTTPSHLLPTPHTILHTYYPPLHTYYPPLTPSLHTYYPPLTPPLHTYYLQALYDTMLANCNFSVPYT